MLALLPSSTFKPFGDPLGDGLHNDGRRLTPQRRKILELFENIGSGMHLSAEDVHHQLLDANNRISLATIYRTLRLLVEMGFDLTNHQIFITELWVQEFAKQGGGNHTLHTHWNGHISGFYFLKASEKTSRPLFEDPRAGNMMNLLPEKDKTQVTYASSQINYEVKPGRMIFFPSYMPHQYIVDMGYEPFRFIHWNCQAIPKGVLNVVQKK